MIVLLSLAHELVSRGSMTTMSLFPSSATSDNGNSDKKTQPKQPHLRNSGDSNSSQQEMLQTKEEKEEEAHDEGSDDDVVESSDEDSTDSSSIDEDEEDEDDDEDEEDEEDEEEIESVTAALPGASSSSYEFSTYWVDDYDSLVHYFDLYSIESKDEESATDGSRDDEDDSGTSDENDSDDDENSDEDHHISSWCERMRASDQFVNPEFDLDVLLPAVSPRPSNRKTSSKDKEPPTAEAIAAIRCLQSHLTTVREAHSKGKQFALVLEADEEDEVDEDAAKARRKNAVEFALRNAPPGWKILQLDVPTSDATTTTANTPSIKRGARDIVTNDPFVSWQPLFTSSRAYLVNRSGMERLLNSELAKALLEEEEEEDQKAWDVGKVKKELDPKMITPDEVLYHIAEDSYTATRPMLIPSYSFEVEGGDGEEGVFASSAHADKSLLVLQNCLIKSSADIVDELSRVKRDYDFVCLYHRTKCDWDINVVFKRERHLPDFDRVVAEMGLSDIVFRKSVTEERFNKFSYLDDVTDKMETYDLVLFKDNDQWISGMAWNTFLDRKGNATIAAPLRHTYREFLRSERQGKPSQWFQLHEQGHWAFQKSFDRGPNGQAAHQKVGAETSHDILPSNEWSHWHTTAEAFEVPILEMFFVLMDGKFAKWFFSQLLATSWKDQSVSWGPDIMWCQAAREFAPKNPSCLLVAGIASRHDDARQIPKSRAFQLAGQQVFKNFGTDPTFSRWITSTKKYKDLIGGKSLGSLKDACQQLLFEKTNEWPKQFDLTQCAQSTLSDKLETDPTKIYWGY